MNKLEHIHSLLFGYGKTAFGLLQSLTKRQDSASTITQQYLDVWCQKWDIEAYDFSEC